MTLPAGTVDRDRVKRYSTAVTWTCGTDGGGLAGVSPGSDGVVTVLDEPGSPMVPPEEGATEVGPVDAVPEAPGAGDFLPWRLRWRQRM
jgi:hypothetical protein